jgi:hypothetical protein
LPQELVRSWTARPGKGDPAVVGLNRVSKSWRQRQDNHSAVGVGNGGCGPLCARSQVLQDVFFLLEQQGAYCLVAFPAPLVSKLTIRGWGGLV